MGDKTPPCRTSLETLKGSEVCLFQQTLSFCSTYQWFTLSLSPLSLSLFFCLSPLSLFFVFLFLSVCVSLCVSPSLSLFLFLSVSLFFCLSLFLCLTLFVCVSLSLSLSLSVSLSFPVCLSLSPSHTLPSPLYLSFFIAFFLPVVCHVMYQ